MEEALRTLRNFTAAFAVYAIILWLVDASGAGEMYKSAYGADTYIDLAIIAGVPFAASCAFLGIMLGKKEEEEE
jgi:hypothetical protein